MTNFDNYARFIGEQRRFEDGRQYRWYEWEVFVNEDAAVLDAIRNVEYRLHPTFPNPNRVVGDRDTRFALRSRGWGEFPIQIRVNFKDGREELTRYELRLGKPWPSGHQ